MSTARRLVVAVLACALAWVLVAQPRNDGFRRGHRGWVTAHTLAIAQRASADNGFLGYTLSLSTPARRDLYYFDRYPVFFAAGLRAAQQLVASDKSEEIHVARQAMNVLYVLTLVMGVMLLVELGITLEVAVAAAALAGAGFTMVEYRDMVHFDQPALLGSVALLWSIAGFYNGRPAWRVVVVSALAVAAGRGYASFAILGLWWVLEVLRMAAGLTAAAPTKSGTGRDFSTRGPGDTAKPSLGTDSCPPAIGKIVRTIVTGVPTRACVLAIAVGSACLTYNILLEARTRDVPLDEVSIVVSAKQRLSLSSGFNERTEKRRRWERFLVSQQNNLVRSTMPWMAHNPLKDRELAQRAAAALIVVAALGFAASRPGPRRIPWLLACLGGPIWLVVMRNLAAFHDYTAMYFFPLCLTFFTALLLKVPRRATTAAALLACAVLVLATNASNARVERQSRWLRQETKEMQNIAGALEPHAEVAIDGPIFPGVPFALGFYLPDHDIVVEGPALRVITRKEDLRGENLTPGNRRIFLYSTGSRYKAKTALARLHPDTAAAHRRERRRVLGRNREE